MIIKTDAFDYYWGGVFKAKRIDSIERIVQHALGKFSTVKINYPTHEKAILAAKEYIDRF